MEKSLSLIPNIRMKREGMTNTEKRVVDWLLDATKFNKSTALNAIANDLDVSEALIVKVAKLLGFSGFRDLRKQITTSFEENQLDTFELSSQDTPQDLVDKVFNVSLQTISEGKAILNSKVISEAAKCFLMLKIEICMLLVVQIQSAMILNINSCVSEFAVIPIEIFI